MNHSNLWQLYQQTWFKFTNSAVTFKIFAVITAFNPGSEICVAKSNDLAQQKLQRDIEALGLAFLPILAGNRDFSYVEPSFAVSCTMKQAMDLAFRYQQNALFWVQDDNVWLVPVTMRQHRATAIGAFRQRLL